MFFKKKEKVQFEATKEFKFANGVLQYDESRNLIQYKNFPIKEIFSPEDIESYELQYGNKTYNKANLGKALVGGALFGVGGVLLAGTHQEEVIKNIQIKFQLKGKKLYYLMPIYQGELKVNGTFAQIFLESAEEIISFLNKVTNREEK